MSNISWSDRRKTIGVIFLEAYFGHVLMGKAIWQELERCLETYFASIQQGKHRRSVSNNETYSEAFIKIVNELMYIITKHPLNRFPVSLVHKREVTKWLVHYLKGVVDEDSSLQDTISKELSVLKEGNENETDIEEEDPEYIYKTFVRRVQHQSSVVEWYYVTLLEENRNIIGHGTTGLTSWQGALFLADWCQTREDKLEVWNAKAILVIHRLKRVVLL